MPVLTTKYPLKNPNSSPSASETTAPTPCSAVNW